MIVSFIIPNYNGEKYIDSCLHSIYNQNMKGVRRLDSIEVIVVDNASTDDSIIIAQRNYKKIRTIMNRNNNGVAAALNQGIEIAKGDYIAVVHVDTVLDKDWLKNSLEIFKDDINNFMDTHILASASLIMKNDGTKLVDCCGFGFAGTGYVYKIGEGELTKKSLRRRLVAAPYNAAALYSKARINKIGGFDESFFAYFEDADIGIRGFLQGFDTIYNPEAKAYHSGFTLSGGQECDFTARFKARNNFYIRYKNLTPMQRFNGKLYLSSGAKNLKRSYGKYGLGNNVEEGIREAVYSRRRCKKEYRNAKFGRKILFGNKMFCAMFKKKTP